MYGVVSYLPLNCIIAMSTGQGFAGILMNIVRYITLFAFFHGDNTAEELKSKKFYESIIFFSFSALVCIACLVSTFFLYKNKFFREKLRNSGEFKDVDPLLKINTEIMDEDDNQITDDSEKFVNFFL